MLQCMTSSKRMLSVTNTTYIPMYVRPRILPSLHLNKATLTTITSSMPTNSSSEQNSPLLMTAIAWPLFTALNSSHGMGRLYRYKRTENKVIDIILIETIVTWQLGRVQRMGVFWPDRELFRQFPHLPYYGSWSFNYYGRPV